MGFTFRMQLLCDVFIRRLSRVRGVQCREGVQPCRCEIVPEEGVVLNADLPQSLRGPVVGQLEAYGALKLFILRREGKEWKWQRSRRGGEKRETE